MFLLNNPSFDRSHILHFLDMGLNLRPNHQPLSIFGAITFFFFIPFNFYLHRKSLKLSILFNFNSLTTTFIYCGPTFSMLVSQFWFHFSPITLEFIHFLPQALKTFNFIPKIYKILQLSFNFVQYFSTSCNSTLLSKLKYKPMKFA